PLVEFFDGGGDFLRQRCELIIDDEDSIGSRRYGDVAAGALQHVNVSGHVRRLDLHAGEIALRLAVDCDGGRGEDWENAEERIEFHRRWVAVCRIVMPASDRSSPRCRLTWILQVSPSQHLMPPDARACANGRCDKLLRFLNGHRQGESSGTMRR